MIWQIVISTPAQSSDNSVRVSNKPIETARPKLRDDLTAMLNKSICETKDLKKLESFWALGIYDLHSRIHHIEAIQGFQINRNKLAAAALAKAIENDSGGYAYHLCSPSSAWILDLPNPEPILTLNEARLTIKADALRQRCRSFRVDYAPFAKINTKLIFQSRASNDVQKIQINTKLLEPGTLGLTCYPNDSNQGPVEWVLVPVNTKVSFNSSLIPYLEKSPYSIRDFENWINKLRASAGLSQLNFNHNQLNQAAKLLAIKNPKITHDRPMLSAIKNSLHSQQLYLIGENRVIGQSASEFAQLFWLSPRHRSLLISPTASHAAFKMVDLGQQKLLVLILASQKSEPQKLSKSH